MKAPLKIVSVTVFIALIFLKAVNFHVYSHSDGMDDLVENCSACKMALEHQQNDLIQPLVFSVTLKVIYLFQPQENPFFKVFYNGIYSSCLTSRPPPTSLI